MPFPTRTPLTLALVLATLASAAAQDAQQGAGDAAAGKVFFGQSCALCHSDVLAADNSVINKQGPSLVGVVGRTAGTVPGFSYTQALKNSGLKWDAPTLDKFLSDPNALVPGTAMLFAVPDPLTRANVIAYLQTLKLAANVKPVAAAPIVAAIPVPQDPGAWENAAPGVAHHITVADLPPPYATKSVGFGPHVVRRPDGADVSVPPGFTAKIFASGLGNARYLRVAPNGDIFLAETGASRIHVLRAADGADTPTVNQVFAEGEGLDHPFGMAFYPPNDPNPKWLYLANHNAIVRIPYHNGDLQASGPPQVVVPQLYGGGGGHSTRDVAFSPDGKRMFISVGSGSNVASPQSAGGKTPDEIKAWEADHGLGAAWDSETNRADILVTDPEGKAPLHTFATGIRNGVGIAVNPTTGDLWTSVNERDGLGDDEVPDYITRVKEGGYYGWPWYYMGNIEDPRWKDARPDLAGKATVPDVLLQAHSASLEMCFYTASTGPAAFPAEYNGDAFAAEHGSWNRSSRTGYKLIRVRIKDGVPTGEYDDFLTGFVVDNTSVWGRPVGVIEAHDGALLMSEDGGGTLWRIAYKKP
ncbi:MAG TPA: PQQ-dependent sugar dehydrogenase [Candidatus Methylacidiphilales bacterium]|nr:PQQ-dependent sugar dehydrogenase [Candidatus Methylacidiphilales bacterium]